MLGRKTEVDCGACNPYIIDALTYVGNYNTLKAKMQ